MNKFICASTNISVVIVLSLSMIACGKDEKDAPKAEKIAPSKEAQTVKPDEISEPAVEIASAIPVPDTSTQDSTQADIADPPPKQESVADTQKSNNKDQMLSLASKSGCLACHSVDRKLVGPAWKDVATRYQGNNEARGLLIEKISRGGKGNWSEITGGVPMPPYFPRVTRDNIERLVDFILSLSKP